jgi:Xaa-Pro dipeptidase
MSFTPQQQRGCCGSETSHHVDYFEPQVLLIDAGCEWKWYASDITRTLPIGNGGKFTDRAAEVYKTVLKMQKVSEM